MNENFKEKYKNNLQIWPHPQVLLGGLVCFVVAFFHCVKMRDLPTE
jgi:hypothetical protein